MALVMRAFLVQNMHEEIASRRLLDHVAANGALSQRFDDCHVENTITNSSDHCAILVYLTSLNLRTENMPVQHDFEFEVMWLKAPNYEHTLTQFWTSSSGGPLSLHATLLLCSKLLVLRENRTRFRLVLSGRKPGNLRRELKQSDWVLTLMLQCKKSGALNIVSANSLREKRSLQVSGREASGFVNVI